METRAQILQKQITFEYVKQQAFKIMTAIRKGYSLESLSSNCEIVCGHQCTDGFESEICNTNRVLNNLYHKFSEEELTEEIIVEAFMAYYL